MEESRRDKLIKDLEEGFNKRVYAIVFNPLKEEGIKEGDEKYLTFFIGRENVRDCILILNGSGGEFKTALLSSCLLRGHLNYYCCFIPSVAGSSLCYFILKANKLLIGKNTILTQIDPLFEYQGESLRAIKNLSNPNKEIKDKAHEIFNYVRDKLRDLLSEKPSLLSKDCFSGDGSIRIDELGKIIDLFMGKEYHESGLQIKDLERLKLNFGLVDDRLVTIGNNLIRECRNELFEEDSRFVIQTNKGGYFFS